MTSLFMQFRDAQSISLCIQRTTILPLHPLFFLYPLPLPFDLTPLPSKLFYLLHHPCPRHQINICQSSSLERYYN